MTTILDGAALAAARAPLLAEHGARIEARNGRPATLLLVAFAGPDGRAPWVRGKLNACAAAHVRVHPLVVSGDADTASALAAMSQAIRAEQPDAVFVQTPCPASIDEAALSDAIPLDADVDVMSADGIARFMNTPDAEPPLTIAAALMLLDHHGVTLRDTGAVVVSQDSAFARMLVESLRRRGAVEAHTVDAGDGSLRQQVGDADVVVAAAGMPGVIRADLLRPGAVAVDLGYFNPGGRGDIDTSYGTGHLSALMPVPGGVGPMTVSALVERTLRFAGG
jgi:methylenetetrahydrofolate dehydrogenase (NADP+) / methenyltetrahydrofolate cyclohydrolase